MQDVARAKNKFLEQTGIALVRLVLGPHAILLSYNIGSSWNYIESCDISLDRPLKLLLDQYYMNLIFDK